MNHVSKNLTTPPRHRRVPAEPTPHDLWNYTARGESPSQRLDRNYGEILQELRVAQTGVQLLLASLLMVAFTPAFTSFTSFQRHVYVIGLILGAAAKALLIAPAAFHRMVFRRRLKSELVRSANVFTLCGLALLMLALTAALLLILSVVLGPRQAAWIAGGTLLWFSLLWYVFPLWSRKRHGSR
ncbi:DUF6328 family protein [Amycolatopsis anabasis]|uniref:DUF6328 family protein n=1 Tax=Amycolatopsis anabasis TaxID=1840409 RepID=UPI001FEBD4F0|nr:DUF6328 family protein [Amycolatopsis anabasis]